MSFLTSTLFSSTLVLTVLVFIVATSSTSKAQSLQTDIFISTTSTIFFSSSLPPPDNWPDNVTACYDELLHSHKLKHCRDESLETYNLTDTDPENCHMTTTTAATMSTSTLNDQQQQQKQPNCTATCYAFYDQLECFDRMACDLCSSDESADFHRAVLTQVAWARRDPGGPCNSVDDYANRTRCFPGPPPVPPRPGKDAGGGVGDLSTTLLVAILCLLLAGALVIVGWMLLKLYLTGDLEGWNLLTNEQKKSGGSQAEEAGGGRRSALGNGRGGKFSSRKEYGPADFMDPKTKSRRRRLSLKSFRNQGRQTSLLKTQQGQLQPLRTPKNGRLSTLKTALKVTSKGKAAAKSSQPAAKTTSSGAFAGGKFKRTSAKAGRVWSGKRKSKTASSSSAAAKQTSRGATKVQKLAVAKTPTTTTTTLMSSKAAAASKSASVVKGSANRQNRSR